MGRQGVVSQAVPNGNIHVESPVKFSSIVFLIPIFTGKWYYEVTLGSSSVFQIGWANQFVDLSQEVPNVYTLFPTFPRAMVWVTICIVLHMMGLEIHCFQ